MLRVLRTVPAMAFLGASLVLSGCKPAQAVVVEKKPEPPASVKLVQPKRGEITRSVALPGTLAANQQTTLYSKVGGYLKQITVDKGDFVKAGDLIAEIEVPELLADIAKYKAEVEVAEIDYKRVVDAQKKAPDLIMLQSLDSAKAKLAIAKAGLDRAETLLKFCKITAPYSGVITKRFVDPGAFVPAATSGSAAQNAALVTLADFNTVRVQVAVPELEVPLVKKGLPVKISIEEFPGKVFEGTVTRFSHVLDESTKTMQAEIDLQNPNGDLRPGMYATIKIGIEKRANALLLPVEAVLVEKAGASIFTVTESKAKKAPVKLGFNDGSFMEVVDGLPESEKVIVVGKMTLNNGQAVNVTE